MSGATLSRDEYWDKVYACWMGKNCGGTLGAPLEKMYGEEEPFDIHWYPEVREGGIPNDDLEMQLVWLKAVEERGFALDARDLAQVWLDCIGYNFDEYGLNKTNLRLGLLPPVSGYYNNWFRDCMGSPIRSEIWACLAPGNPHLAARYAFEDASVDHAGGEGVWGEVFNATVEAAAFVQRDPQQLIEIGLSYLPAESAVTRAVRVAREAHAAGVEWREARRRVLAATPHYNAQYAPPNLGFQVIGWLYGAEFGDAICTAVNCGYDTDCTGATLGALLGILNGRAGLPERWTAPLGEQIATNASWGGLRNVSDGPFPIPTTLTELTDRVCAQGERLLAARGDALLRIGERSTPAAISPERLRATAEDWAALHATAPATLRRDLATFRVEIDYGDSPVIAAGEARSLALRLRNTRDDALTIETALHAPDGWTATLGEAQALTLPAQGEATLRVEVRVESPAALENANALTFIAQPQGRPAELQTPIPLVGARRLLVWSAPSPDGADAGALLERPFAPEDRLTGGSDDAAALTAAPEGWRVVSVAGNDLTEALGADWTGVVYARLWLWGEREMEVRLGVPATTPRALWLNGHRLLQTTDRTLLRPNYSGDGVSYANATLRRGWNDALVKYTRDAQTPPFAGHLTLAHPGSGLEAGMTEARWTRLPWEDRNAVGE